MIDDLYQEAITRSLIEAYLKAPKQGLLIVGAKGMGSGSLAKALASQQCPVPTDIVVVEPDEKGTITIERVRALYVETRAARTNTQVVVIDNLELMSQDAQNSFLKLLEEPGNQVRFIMTVHSPESLLETIISRVEVIQLKPLTTTDSQRLLRSLGVKDDAKLQQLLFIANGQPAELSRLATDADYFESQAKLVRWARDFLAGTKYQRLIAISQLIDRSSALEALQVLANLVAFSGKKSTTIYQNGLVQSIEKAADSLTKNGHLRTQLMSLALKI